jgi:hypothetical protein
MVTRKSIGDKYGYKSVYAVEQLSWDGTWAPVYFEIDYVDAEIKREKHYKEMKRDFGRQYSRNRLRIRLYVRAED